MLTVAKLVDVDQTAKEMYRLAKGYKDDMAGFSTFSVIEIFDWLKALPYRADPKGIEFLQRPYYTIRREGRGGDCDDKAICVGAWSELNGANYRFVAVGRLISKPLHHVFTEVFLEGVWISVDPTYAHNTIGQTLPYARRKVLLRS